MPDIDAEINPYLNNVTDSKAATEYTTSIRPPTKKQIKDAREKIQADIGITEAQRYCAGLIYKGLRTWQQWETGARKMDPAFWELFCIKTNTQK